MKNRHRLWNICIFAVSTASLFWITPVSAQSDENCALPSAWFAQGGSIPDPSAAPGQDPSQPNGGLAFSSDFSSFCAFNTWAWNAFLYAMESEGDGVLRFETYPTQEQTIDGNWSEGDVSGAGKLFLRVGKANHAIDSAAQAGTTGILVAHNNRAVYYSQHINPVMYDQIIDLNWNTAKGIADTPVEKGLFAIGSIEYKAAWAIVDDSMQVPNAYTRQASVPKLVNNSIDGVTVIGVPQNPAHTEYMDVTVALIGFHVVGWVKDHSEAIWASFSPKDIAPVMSGEIIEEYLKSVADPNSNPVFPDVPVSSSGGPFYTANITAPNCNQTQTPVQRLDETTQLLSLVSQVCQVYAGGGLPGKDDSNTSVIGQLNASAAMLVPDSNPADGYTEIGAVWSSKSDNQPDPTVPVLNPDKLNVTFQSQLIGSEVLSNPVIETFTQSQAGQDNCFACHNSLQFQPTVASNPDMQAPQPSMLNLSHFVMQIYEKTYESN